MSNSHMFATIFVLNALPSSDLVAAVNGRVTTLEDNTIVLSAQVSDKGYEMVEGGAEIIRTVTGPSTWDEGDEKYPEFDIMSNEIDRQFPTV